MVGSVHVFVFYDDDNPERGEKERESMTGKDDKCKKCGHARMHHTSRGGLSFCAAVLSRGFDGKLCDCKEFKL